jgi:hypothetical protein
LQKSKRRPFGRHSKGRNAVNNIIYLVGLVVIVLAVLSFVGLS